MIEAVEITQAKTIKLTLSKSAKLARVTLDEHLIYEGSLEGASLEMQLAGYLFSFNEGTAEELFLSIREHFRKLQLGLKWEFISYESPFAEDVIALWSGEIEPSTFNSYPETSQKSWGALDGSYPLNGKVSQELVATALAKLAEVNRGSVETPRVNLVHALLSAVKEYGATAEGLTSLKGLGLDEALELSKQLISLPKVTENALIFESYAPAFSRMKLATR